MISKELFTQIIVGLDEQDFMDKRIHDVFKATNEDNYFADLMSPKFKRSHEAIIKALVGLTWWDYMGWYMYDCPDRENSEIWVGEYKYVISSIDSLYAWLQEFYPDEKAKEP